MSKGLFCNKNILLAFLALAVLYWLTEPDLRGMVCGDEGFSEQAAPAAKNGKDVQHHDPATGKPAADPRNDPLVGDFNAQTLPNDFLPDGNNGQNSIQHNLCSRSCCSTQYPTPFALKEDPFVAANKDDYIPSNYFCNNVYQDSGCLCLTKDQHKFLNGRGGNREADCNQQ